MIHRLTILYFWTAVSFLSRLPIPARWQLSEPSDFRTLPHYFWMAGLFLGILQGFVVVLLILTFPFPIAIALTMAVLVLSTGAFHEDGWADVADSFGGYTQERKLEIMKDSRLGTFGVSALIIVFLVRFVAYSQLGDKGLYAVFSTIVLVNGWSRWSSVQLLRVLPYLSSKDYGSGKGIAGDFDPPNNRASLIGLVSLTLLTVLSLHWNWILLMPVVTGLSIWVSYLFYKIYLGGINGDCLGSVTILTELLILISLCTST